MIKKVKLLHTPKEFYLFATVALLLFLSSLLIEYYHYKKLIEFDSITIDAKVVKAYIKTKELHGKTLFYQVLQLQSKEGYRFYTVSYKIHPDLYNRELHVKLYDIPETLGFYNFLKGFFLKSKILSVSPPTLQHTIENSIEAQHSDAAIQEIYKALFLAKPLPKELQNHFSYLGISHLIAISGFHLSVLFALVYFVLRFPYSFLQQRFFPYRQKRLDIFIIAFALFVVYALFINTPPSLLRALIMLFIGYFLYNRSFEIISVQTLFVTLVSACALFPHLLLSVGFWLSIGGVFYIFVYLKHFQKQTAPLQFFLLPIYVYLSMLPYSLYLFENFSWLHPASIILSILFTPFYPLSLLAHILHFGSLFDPLLHFLLKLPLHPLALATRLDGSYIILYILLSLGAFFYKKVFFLQLFVTLALFGYFILFSQAA